MEYDERRRKKKQNREIPVISPCKNASAHGCRIPQGSRFNNYYPNRPCVQFNKLQLQAPVDSVLRREGPFKPVNKIPVLAMGFKISSKNMWGFLGYSKKFLVFWNSTGELVM